MYSVAAVVGFVVEDGRSDFSFLGKFPNDVDLLENIFLQVGRYARDEFQFRLFLL